MHLSQLIPGSGSRHARVSRAHSEYRLLAVQGHSCLDVGATAGAEKAAGMDARDWQAATALFTVGEVCASSCIVLRACLCYSVVIAEGVATAHAFE
jgi:hypothetical protein